MINNFFIKFSITILIISFINPIFANTINNKDVMNTGGNIVAYRKDASGNMVQITVGQTSNAQFKDTTDSSKKNSIRGIIPNYEDYFKPTQFDEIYAAHSDWSWEILKLIKEHKIKIGMTKEQVDLSLNTFVDTFVPYETINWNKPQLKTFDDNYISETFSFHIDYRKTVTLYFINGILERYFETNN